VQWSETASDRVAKLARRDSSGEPVIPLSLHEKKMCELAKALRRESVNMLEARSRPSEVQEEQFLVEGFFRRQDVSPKDKARVFDRVVEYYKDEPSAARAQLLQDLKNDQLKDIVGMSSATAAKARQGRVAVNKAGSRKRSTASGLPMERVREIALKACFDKRYCEIRSWSNFTGGHSVPHLECVGLVDVRTMYENLCTKHG
jgi:hypothetical protein